MNDMRPEERFRKIENALEALAGVQAKHENAIRDMILVSRTFIDSQQKMAEAQKLTDERLARLAEATDERLTRLAETVERLARLMGRRSHPNGENQ